MEAVNKRNQVFNFGVKKEAFGNSLIKIKKTVCNQLKNRQFNKSAVDLKGTNSNLFEQDLLSIAILNLPRYDWPKKAKAGKYYPHTTGI